MEPFIIYYLIAATSFAISSYFIYFSQANAIAREHLGRYTRIDHSPILYFVIYTSLLTIIFPLALVVVITRRDNLKTDLIEEIKRIY